MRLLVEILEIFYIVIRAEGEKIRKPTYCSAIALCLTCELFNRVTRPLLYRNPCFTKPMGFLPITRRAELFHRALKADPSL